MIGLDKTAEGFSFEYEHVLNANQFDRETLQNIFQLAPVMKKHALEADNILASCTRLTTLLFEQPSTRTYSSFWAAAFYLGAKVIFPNQEAAHGSSFAKGESIDHTIEYYCRYPRLKVIVMRHHRNMAAFEAAQIADPYGVHIVNAGDGTRQHPTQSLLDVYTMWERRGNNLDGVKLAVCNDLAHSRTVTSLCLLLAKNFQIPEIVTCAPEGIDLPNELKKEILSYGTKITRVDNLYDAANWADFLYTTRPQLESHEGISAEIFNNFRVDKNLLDQLPDDSPCLLMHPMPIDSKNFCEIAKDADHHPRCIIFDQAENGIYIRMALLKMLLA